MNLLAAAGAPVAAIATAKTFVGPDCGLCPARAWTVSRKQFSMMP